MKARPHLAGSQPGLAATGPFEPCRPSCPVTHHLCPLLSASLVLLHRIALAHGPSIAAGLSLLAPGHTPEPFLLVPKASKALIRSLLSVSVLSATCFGPPPYPLTDPHSFPADSLGRRPGRRGQHWRTTGRASATGCQLLDARCHMHVRAEHRILCHLSVDTGPYPVRARRTRAPTANWRATTLSLALSSRGSNPQSPCLVQARPVMYPSPRHPSLSSLLCGRRRRRTSSSVSLCCLLTLLFFCPCLQQ